MDFSSFCRAAGPSERPWIGQRRCRTPICQNSHSVSLIVPSNAGRYRTREHSRRSGHRSHLGVCLGVLACGRPDAVVGALQEAIRPAGQPIPDIHSQEAFPGGASLHVHSIPLTHTYANQRGLQPASVLTAAPHHLLCRAGACLCDAGIVAGQGKAGAGERHEGHLGSRGVHSRATGTWFQMLPISSISERSSTSLPGAISRPMSPVVQERILTSLPSPSRRLPELG